ncbi:MAG TPA: cadherin-like beta sandwich domain-containing protein [Nitrospira sp.]|nr:cadherin-like beta sandwich domain-containing protein [Nitrospira sp.]
MKYLLISTSYRTAAILLITLCFIASGCKDSASISEQTVEVPLAGLTITPPGALHPAFSSNTTSYSATVATTVTSVTVTASPKNSMTTIIIDGETTPPGQGHRVSFEQPGLTKTIKVVTSSQNGIESAYTITVTRLLSSDNDLSSLRTNTGSFNPAFAPGITTYTVNVATDVTDVTLSATKSDPDAIMSGSVLAGNGQANGQATIPLGGPGTGTPVSISITAPSGLLKTYSLTINRLFSNNSNLSAMSANTGVTTVPLDPVFTPGTVSYAVNVGLLVPDVTIKATKSDPNATMSALGSVIATAGTPTGQVTIMPGLGPNPPVGITVIAQDGVSSTTYNITVTRGLF